MLKYILCAIVLSKSITTFTPFEYSLIPQYIIANKKASILGQNRVKKSAVAKLNASPAL